MWWRHHIISTAIESIEEESQAICVTTWFMLWFMMWNTMWFATWFTHGLIHGGICGVIHSLWDSECDSRCWRAMLFIHGIRDAIRDGIRTVIHYDSLMVWFIQCGIHKCVIHSWCDSFNVGFTSVFDSLMVWFIQCGIHECFHVFWDVFHDVIFEGMRHDFNSRC